MRDLPKVTFSENEENTAEYRRRKLPDRAEYYNNNNKLIYLATLQSISSN